MKIRYTLFYLINYKEDKFIEVINDLFCNEVIHYGWNKRISYDASKDETTIGVWKIKKLKN